MVATALTKDVSAHDAQTWVTCGAAVHLIRFQTFSNWNSKTEVSTYFSLDLLFTRGWILPKIQSTSASLNCKKLESLYNWGYMIKAKTKLYRPLAGLPRRLQPTVLNLPLNQEYLLLLSSHSSRAPLISFIPWMTYNVHRNSYCNNLYFLLKNIGWWLLSNQKTKNIFIILSSTVCVNMRI